MRKNANTYNCLPAIIDANVMFLLSAKAFIGSKGEKIDAQLKTLIMCKSSSCVPRIEIDSLFYKDYIIIYVFKRNLKIMQNTDIADKRQPRMIIQFVI